MRNNTTQLENIMDCEIKERHSNISSKNVEIKFVDGRLFFLIIYFLEIEKWN